MGYRHGKAAHAGNSWLVTNYQSFGKYTKLPLATLVQNTDDRGEYKKYSNNSGKPE
jgi:hypothetical protein